MKRDAPITTEARRRLGVGAGVAALHVCVLIGLGFGVVPALPDTSMRTMDVVLTRPSALPLETARTSGSGSAAAPSKVHRPPDPRPEIVGLPASVQQAALQPLVLNLSPVVSPAPADGDDLGLGEGGSGQGAGSGEGTGTGVGGATGATLITGPAGAVISRDVATASLAERGGSHVILRCRIRLTQRLEDCRVVGEHPMPSGRREEALSRAAEFRFRPPRRAGRNIDGSRIVVAIRFPVAADLPG